ncbi:2-hydroxychromene-2-carboxylate isomerase [Streptomyces sp. NBC_00572]|uniref:2-hydroxychromene-2-carboxylate isomerase n=1 Tax=Streptomyces sp. NBC_00572 TaxID=2903664 RepID=UPI00224F96E2|nr:DsbA family protein [Streptomyces sp. NBC_00572]MCX4984945.1 DsbA family protein [Streptomyces sp. NBC_00572]
MAPPDRGAGRTAVPKRRFYFSLRSPYSWLAHHDLMNHHAGPADTLEWVPYWEPDERTTALLSDTGSTFVYTQMSRAKHFYILADVRRLANDRGLKVSWPVDHAPVWEVPHLAYLAARRRGLGPAFVEQAQQARWQEGLDICDRATMAGIADRLGLARDVLTGAADDPGLREEGAEALRSAIREGVFGVPFFVNGHDKYWGVDRLSAFLASLAPDTDAGGGPGPSSASASASESVAAEADVRPGGDIGHAGGCG